MRGPFSSQVFRRCLPRSEPRRCYTVFIIFIPYPLSFFAPPEVFLPLLAFFFAAVAAHLHLHRMAGLEALSLASCGVLTG